MNIRKGPAMESVSWRRHSGTQSKCELEVPGVFMGCPPMAGVAAKDASK